MLPDASRQHAKRKFNPYPTDLSDEQWKIIKSILPGARRGGRRRSTSMRAVVNAIFYVVRTGCAWRYLPRDFPPWQTVYDYFLSWRDAGVLHALHAKLRTKCRESMDRNPEAHVFMIDSQSTKCQFGESRGWDGFKKVRGRKRHIVCDTLGLIHAQQTTPAEEKDHVAALKMFDPEKKEFANMQEFYADGSYKVASLFQHLEENFGVTPTYKIAGLEKRDDKSRVTRTLVNSNLTPVRWIVERTFAWFNNYRRLARDYERTVASSQSTI